MHEDGTVVLTDFELAKEMRRNSINIPYSNLLNDGVLEECDDNTISVSVSGTRGFMAPEVYFQHFKSSLNFNYIF
jgi:serine/threonine protein kinase